MNGTDCQLSKSALKIIIRFPFEHWKRFLFAEDISPVHTVQEQITPVHSDCARIYWNVYLKVFWCFSCVETFQKLKVSLDSLWNSLCISCWVAVKDKIRVSVCRSSTCKGHIGTTVRRMKSSVHSPWSVRAKCKCGAQVKYCLKSGSYTWDKKDSGVISVQKQTQWGKGGEM